MVHTVFPTPEQRSVVVFRSPPAREALSSHSFSFSSSLSHHVVATSLFGCHLIPQPGCLLTHIVVQRSSFALRPPPPLQVRYEGELHPRARTRAATVAERRGAAHRGVVVGGGGGVARPRRVALRTRRFVLRARPRFDRPRSRRGAPTRHARSVAPSPPPPARASRRVADRARATRLIAPARPSLTSPPMSCDVTGCHVSAPRPQQPGATHLRALRRERHGDKKRASLAAARLRGVVAPRARRRRRRRGQRGPHQRAAPPPRRAFPQGAPPHAVPHGAAARGGRARQERGGMEGKVSSWGEKGEKGARHTESGESEEGEPMMCSATHRSASAEAVPHATRASRPAARRGAR